MLAIKNLSVSIEGKPILKDVNLIIGEAETHVIMGPNGTGKSTLGHVLMANPKYDVDEGSMILNGEDLGSLDTAQRAQRGLFLAFQYPVSIPGLKISEYLRELYSHAHKEQISVSEFRKYIYKELDLLQIDRTLLQRYLNEGLSGGEMKRFEMLQLAILKPKIAILDEIDSGLDVDGQKAIAQAIERATNEFKTSFILVTHYQRLVNFLNPKQVHIMLDGTIARSGNKELIEGLEREGYNFVKEQKQELSY
jgi:Fe-S cluster assembly ATP-binding protein